MKNHFEVHDIDSALEFLGNFEKLSPLTANDFLNIKARKVKEVKCKKVKTVK